MRWIGRAVVVGFAVLLVIGAVEARRETAADQTDVVDELVAAWTRSRTSTYRATGTFTRWAPDGRSITAEAEVVQRPPDRLVRQFGEVVGRRDDRVLRCPAPVDDASSGAACALGPAGAVFAEVVAQEVDAFETLVRGDEPLYLVARRFDGCFRLERTRYDPRAGYGIGAVLCFDRETGALASVEIDHGDITERTVYGAITRTVRDHDLEP